MGQEEEPADGARRCRSRRRVTGKSTAAVRTDRPRSTRVARQTGRPRRHVTRVAAGRCPSRRRRCRRHGHGTRRPLAIIAMSEMAQLRVPLRGLGRRGRAACPQTRTRSRTFRVSCTRDSCRAFTRRESYIAYPVAPLAFSAVTTAAMPRKSPKRIALRGYCRGVYDAGRLEVSWESRDSAGDAQSERRAPEIVGFAVHCCAAREKRESGLGVSIRARDL